MTSPPSTWPAGLSGTEALDTHAPEVAATVERLVRTLSTSPDRVALVRRACAEVQGLPRSPLHRAPKL